MICVLLFINIYILIVLNRKDVIMEHLDDVIRTRTTSNGTSTSKIGGKIPLVNKYCLDYLQNGTFFKSDKKIISDGFVSFCFLMSFSQTIEKEFSEKFLNVFQNVTSWVKSPSILRHNNMYYVTFRIRLQEPIKEQERSRHGILKSSCFLNYLYLKKFNLNFSSFETGEIVAIATPLGKQRYRNGAHDARLFQLKDEIYALLSINMDDNWISTIWNFQKHKPTVPKFQKELLQEGRRISDKNWVPLVMNNTLYIIRHLDPLHVLKCSTTETCRFIWNDTDAISYQMVDREAPLR